jgi:hypothetical protein
MARRDLQGGQVDSGELRLYGLPSRFAELARVVELGVAVEAVPAREMAVFAPGAKPGRALVQALAGTWGSC